MRARTDHTHPPLQHVDELRQFVEGIAAQEGAEAGHALIGAPRLLYDRAVLGDRHGAEFVNLYLASIEPVAALPEQHRSSGAQFDADRDGEQQWQAKGADQQREDDIAGALHDAVESREGSFTHRRDGYTADGIDVRLDQVEQKDVRHEVDRRRGVVQFVQQPDNAWLRGHRQRDVDHVHSMRFDVGGQLIERAQDRA